MIGLNHSPYLSQYKITIVAEELLFKNHRLLILMCQTRALRTGVPKSIMLLFLLVLVCPSLSWRINPSPALSKMTTTSSLEISTGREHCQTTSCTEEGLFPEGGPDRMTWWHDDMMTWWNDDMMTWSNVFCLMLKYGWDQLHDLGLPSSKLRLTDLLTYLLTYSQG